jgi:RNA polymerase sigma-70 factor (ECF subfamily)
MPTDLEPDEPPDRVKGMYLTSTPDGAPAFASPQRSELALQASDVAADFDAFYRSARPSIATALALSLGDVDVATDATDEAMARAYERWATVARLDRPEAWVYRVASNWALSVFRRRRLSLHRMYAPDSVDAAGVGDPAVHAAVAALDIKHRSVVVCRHLLGWSVADTATALGISEGTVKSRLSRATTTLRTRLRDVNATEEQS